MNGSADLLPVESVFRRPWSAASFAVKVEVHCPVFTRLKHSHRVFAVRIAVEKVRVQLGIWVVNCVQNVNSCQCPSGNEVLGVFAQRFDRQNQVVLRARNRKPP